MFVWGSLSSIGEGNVSNLCARRRLLFIQPVIVKRRLSLGKLRRCQLWVYHRLWRDHTITSRARLDCCSSLTSALGSRKASLIYTLLKNKADGLDCSELPLF